MTTITRKCPKHPRYAGKAAPRVPCRNCWAIYFKAPDRCNTHFLPPPPSLAERVRALEAQADLNSMLIEDIRLTHEEATTQQTGVTGAELQRLLNEISRYLDTGARESNCGYSFLLRRVERQLERLLR